MNYNTYREILTEELDKRVKINPGYSMRAFAAKLGLSPSRLSEILNNKQGLSVKSAASISKNLNFDPYKSKLFSLLVESSQARSELKRSLIKKELKEFREHLITEVPLDQYHFISDWQYYTIIELLKTEDIIHSTKWIASKLSLPEKEIISSIERLKRLGMIKYQKGKFIITDMNPFSTIAYTPSDALKEHHNQIIKKAEMAIYDQDIDEREYNTLIFALNDDEIEIVKNKIRKFYNDLNIEFSNKKTKNNRVYALSSQLFNLLKTPQTLKGPLQ